jgi:hypothetical protein
MKERVDDWHRSHPGQSTLVPRDSSPPVQREQPPHLNSNFVTFSAPCPNDAASGFLLESTPATVSSPTRIVELEEDDTDPIQRYLCEQLALCAVNNPRIHVLEAEISKRRTEVAEGVEKKRALHRTNKGRPAVRFADEQHEGRTNGDLRNRPNPSPIREESPERDESPPPAPLRSATSPTPA